MVKDLLGLLLSPADKAVSVRPVVTTSDPGLELLGTLVAGENLVLLLREHFLAVNVVHLDVEGPALAHEHAGAAFVGAHVVVLANTVLFLD